MSERAKRIGQHVPVGGFNAWLLFSVSLGLGIAFAVGFFVYQIMEFIQLKNRGWLDIYGWLIGIGAFAVAAFMLGGSWNGI